MASKTDRGAEELIKAYFNEKAAIWDDGVAEKDPAKLGQMAGRLDIMPGSAVLDAGTGTGVLVPFLLRKLGKKGRLVCLDLAEEMLKRAKAKGFEGDIEYICADVTDSRLANESFDAVVCYSSFPHFQDKPKALREIHRVLKMRGKLFICHTSGRQAINEIHCRIPEVQNDLIPEEDEMRKMLLSAGFTEIDISDGHDTYSISATKNTYHR